jgi:flagellar protein FliO/FliZ
MFKTSFIFFFIFAVSLFGEKPSKENSLKSISFTKEELLNQNQNQKPFDPLEENIEKDFPKFEFKGAFIKMMLSLLAVIVLGIITFIMFKRITRTRFIQANNNMAIKVLEKRVLSPKSIIYLVEYEGVKALVSESHLDVNIKILK